MNLSATAYLVAGLQRAASNNGTGPTALGELADAQLHSWNVQASHNAEGHWAVYEVKLDVPVLSEGVVQLTIRGRVRDIRPRTLAAGLRGAVAQGSSAETVFGKGLPLDTLVTADLNRKTLLNRHIMPWLSSHQVPTRGARCALVDHPLPEVKQVVYAGVTNADMPQLAAFPTAWREHILATYRDPGLQWGNAACPDDITVVRQLIATLGLPGARTDRRGLEIDSVARYAGIAADDVHQLVVPTVRYGQGFDRPQYLAYTDAQPHRVQIISCPHGCDQGLCDLVALYPEVSASGYGVICSTCWRLPNVDDPRWKTIVFLAIYGRPFNRVSPKGSLRDEAQTVTAAPAVPLAVVDW